MLAPARQALKGGKMVDEKKETKDLTEDVKKRKQGVEAEGQELPTKDDFLLEKEEEIRSHVDRLKRLQAEFENYKKRVLHEMANLEERISDREILDFLPLYDNLQRAFTSFSGNNDAQSFIEGIERIFAQFDEILKQKEVSPIETIGSLFDPAKHEALLSVESNKERNEILEEFERGYLRNGRVLQPSKVKVSKGKTETEEEKT